MHFLLKKVDESDTTVTDEVLDIVGALMDKIKKRTTD